MRALIKRITHPFLKLGLKIYYLKPRKYCYDTICIKVHPDVFPPHLTLSTKILLDFTKPLDIESKTFLELGCGCGIISIFASKKGAKVTATDINKNALDFLNKNAAKNQSEIEIMYSDLFEKLENKSFDYILINPPYYPRKPKNIKENAWFCGENFEYFEKLFLQLPNFTSSQNNTYMILSEDCEIEKIKAIALKNEMTFELILEKKVLAENNYIFKITSL